MNKTSILTMSSNWLVKAILTNTLLFSFLVAFSQKEAFVWYFGRKAGLDFNTTPPTMLSNSPNTGNADTDEAHATISDKDGNLLFYTNGQTIWNKNLVAMPNGTGLNGNWSSTQCATVFPVPGSTTEYFVITTPVTGSSNELQWTRVDMALAAGLGDVKTPVASNKNQAMPSCPTYMMESVVSVPHFNGTDIWVIAHTADDPSTGGNEGGSFVVWLVTSAGIAYSNTYTLGYAYPQDAGSSKGIGIMKSNSCFNRLFISYYNGSSRIEGFTFNNNTGAVTNWPAPVSAPLVLDQYRSSAGTMVTTTSFSYGLEVSPNGRYLYNTIAGEGGSTRALVQYDLQAGTGSNADIENSCVNITPASPDGERYGQLQLGPDGKIYHTLFNWNNIASGYCKIAVINFPNLGGAAADYVESVYIWPNTATGVGSSMGLTSFHKGFVSGRAAITSTVGNLEEVCLGDVLDLTAQSAGNVVSYEWNIDKNLNTSIDYTTGPTINHTYSSTGTYTVELVVEDVCGYTYTSQSQVKVLPKVTTAGTVSCSPIRGNVTSPNASYTYVWYSDAATTNAIATGTTNVSLPVGTSGTVYLKATSGSSSTTYNLTNGTASAPADNNASTTTLDFTVNKSVLTFGSFQWKTRDASWSAGNVFQNATITITNTATSEVVYTRTQSVLVSNPSNSAGVVYTENVNTVLPAGNYRITISGPGVGIRYRANHNGCAANMADAEGALTYNTLGGECIATVFTYSLNRISTTTLACSQVATIPFNCPLPVDFMSFMVTKSEEGALLKWITASETNNHYFSVERSLDGTNFEEIGTVQGAGNSSEALTYYFTDDDKNTGVVYYRIKQVDYDKQYSYSEIRHINFENEFTFYVSPNPNNGAFSLYLSTGEFRDNYSVQITDMLGKVVLNQATDVIDNKLDMNLQHLAKGVYLIRLVGVDSSYITKIVVE